MASSPELPTVELDATTGTTGTTNATTTGNGTNTVPVARVRVRLINLTKPTLNGQLGTRTTWHEDKQRFTVALLDTSLKKHGRVNVKPQHLEVVDEESISLLERTYICIYSN